MIDRMSKALAWVGAVMIILMLFAGAAEARGARTSVINGETASPGTFPYMAFVLSKEGETLYLCSGSVVSSNVILTAGHCVLNANFSALRSPSSFSVVTGNVDWASESRTVSAVSRVAINPNFAYLTSNDIPVRADVAVLGLSQTIPAPPVQFAKTKTWEAGTPITMVGWGRTNANQLPPETLHFGESVVQSSSFCSSEFSAFQASWDLCALDYPYEEFTTCEGDSGGPILMTAPGTMEQPLEIGVTSFGSAECSSAKAAYFSRTDAVGSWIQQKINEYAPPPPPPPPASQPAPTSQLPTLTTRDAKKYTLRSLGEGLGGRFRGHRGYYVSCRRLNSAKQRCHVSFWVGERDYWGYVTVYYALENGTVVWNDRYTIKEVNNYCYYYSGHRRSCRITTYRR